MPKVSVVVPSYNHARYLPQRLDSILGQTVRDLDVTIIDDASSDNSLEILRKYEKDPRVRLIVNPANSGNTFKNWNAGVRASSGEFLWIAESDDYADALFLETLLARLERSPSVGLAYCRSFMVGDRNEVLGTDDTLNKKYFARNWAEDHQANGKDEIVNFLVFRNTIPNASAVVMRRENFERIGFAAEDFTLAGDWHTWIKMLQVSDIFYCAKPLNYFRCHDSSIRQRMSGKIGQMEESCRIFQYVVSTMDLNKQKIEEIQDFLVERWWDTLRNHPKEFFSLKNLSIYRLAAWQDPHFPSRLAKKILAKALNFMRSPGRQEQNPHE
jgi:glycosyltransferase involved in cell wall biosynthesis